MTAIDDEALARLRSLLAKATPGEWMLATSCSWRRILTTAGKPVIVPTIQRSDDHPDMDCGTEYVNAELAIAAVNAIPALLDNYEAVANAPVAKAAVQRDSAQIWPILDADLGAAREPSPRYLVPRRDKNPEWFRLTMRSGVATSNDNIIGDIRDQRTAYLIGSLMRALDENDHPEYSHFTVVPCTGGGE